MLKQSSEGYEDSGNAFRAAKEKYMRPLTRLDNFLYYFKWILLIGAVAAVLVIFIVIQAVDNESEDLRVVLMSYDHPFGEYEDQLRDVLTKNCADYNKDGEVNVMVRSIDLTTRDFTDEYVVTESEKFAVELRKEASQIIISDEEFYDYGNEGRAEGENAFVDLSGELPEEALYKGHGVRVSRLLPDAALPDNLIIYVRAALPDFNNSQKAEGYRAEALEVLRALRTCTNSSGARLSG